MLQRPEGRGPLPVYRRGGGHASVSANAVCGPDRFPDNRAHAGEHDLPADSPSLLAAVRKTCAARGLDAAGFGCCTTASAPHGPYLVLN